MNLNPSLNQMKRPRKTVHSPTPRKVRNDKKHDIKIPLTPELDRLIRQSCREQGLTKTVYTTMLLEKALARSYVFPEVPYEDSEITTHAKVDKETYKILGGYADKWGHSVRRASHRMFIEMFRIETGGVVIEKV